MPQVLVAGERFQLGIRVTPDLKRRLDAAAEAGGRSQSQEAEFRLERSFDHEDLLPEALTLAYGRKLAGMLMAVPRIGIGGAFLSMAGMYAFAFGALLRLPGT